MMYSWKMHIKHLMHMGLSHILNPMKWKKISHAYVVGHNEFFKDSKLGKRVSNDL